ncbi:MAG: Gluconokinase [Candidatus Nitrospira kreftii]|uniref:Gluconokinase n=1 Tax=Candidatus Nitrospira kreftii TaxID=2652173 RepID=A0A7S8FFV4_9BACT|nr:MAG: Gluconokinase [Candidatus Nitrospira kreftii]
MHRDLLASQFEVLEEPREAFVTDVDNSPNGIVTHIRFGLVLGKESEYGRERRMVNRI